MRASLQYMQIKTVASRRQTNCQAFWVHHSGVPQLNKGLFGSRWLVTETAWCVKGLDADGKALEARGLPWIPFEAVMTKSKRRQASMVSKWLHSRTQHRDHMKMRERNLRQRPHISLPSSMRHSLTCCCCHRNNINCALKCTRARNV